MWSDIGDEEYSGRRRDDETHDSDDPRKRQRTGPHVSAALATGLRAHCVAMIRAIEEKVEGNGAACDSVCALLDAILPGIISLLRASPMGPDLALWDDTERDVRESLAHFYTLNHAYCVITLEAFIAILEGRGVREATRSWVHLDHRVQQADPKTVLDNAALVADVASGVYVPLFQFMSDNGLFDPARPLSYWTGNSDDSWPGGTLHNSVAHAFHSLQNVLPYLPDEYGSERRKQVVARVKGMDAGARTTPELLAEFRQLVSAFRFVRTVPQDREYREARERRAWPVGTILKIDTHYESGRTRDRHGNRVAQYDAAKPEFEVDPEVELVEMPLPKAYLVEKRFKIVVIDASVFAGGDSWTWEYAVSAAEFARKHVISEGAIVLYTRDVPETAGGPYHALDSHIDKQTSRWTRRDVRLGPGEEHVKCRVYSGNATVIDQVAARGVFATRSDLYRCIETAIE